MLEDAVSQLRKNIIWVVLQDSDGDLELAAGRLGITVEELKAQMEELGLDNNGNRTDEGEGRRSG